MALIKLFILILLVGSIYAISSYNSGRPNSDKEVREELLTRAERVKEERKQRSIRASHEARVQRAEKILAGTPLAGYGEEFINCDTRYGLPAGFTIGVSRAESSFGRHYTLSNNPWNYGIYLGLTFSDMVTGACHVAKKVAENYDTSSLYSIAVKYAPSSDGNNPRHWANTVGEVVAQIN